MSLINMLSPWQWILMATVPPLIIMLYFLKLRRNPVQVPSTYLWQRTIEDLHVNSIWQRLRKNLLLLLQLLVVLAFILACLRPGFRGEETLGARSIFMIDNSSSMQSQDLDQSRLAEAKERALEMVEALGKNDVAMIIAFSDRADVRQGFTSDKARLREAIKSIPPTNRTTDLNEALRAASGLANPGRTSQVGDLNDVQVAEAMPAMLYIMSDGGFSAPQMDLGNLAAEYIPIGDALPINVGIVAFTAERNTEKDDQVEAFALVQNFCGQEVTATASLTLDGELIDASEVEIEAFATTGVNFEIQNLVEGQLQLELEYADDFPLDNAAFAGLDPPRELEVVLVTNGNTPLEAALATEQATALANVRIMEPESLETENVVALSESGTVDLFIYDNCAPKKMPEANTFFLGALPPVSVSIEVEGEESEGPSADEEAVVENTQANESEGGPNLLWKAGELTGPLFVIDINRSHPILQYVDMGTVRIVEGRALEMPSGGVELVRSQEGVLFGVAPRDAYQDAVLGMRFATPSEDGGVIPNTDWPIKRSFPVFVLNALEYLGGAVSTSGSKSIRPGQPGVLNLASRFDEVEVVDPLGKSTKLNRAGGPQLIHTQTDELGFYRVKPVGDDRTLQMFTVNLFSDRESDIAPAEEVLIGAQNVGASSDQKDISRIEYWRWLLALALVLLAVEWYLYNRRISV
ncbi:MAG: BatA and WFA domain-containing protein [Planctomycetota bacterium]|nr:BatA and WFA domain-containing protein [Planctomycetota bacterium]